jgi:hypothetical protein
MKNELIRFGNQFPLVAMNLIKEDIDSLFTALDGRFEEFDDYELYVGPNEIILKIAADEDGIPGLKNDDFIDIVEDQLGAMDVDVAQFNFCNFVEKDSDSVGYYIYRYQVLLIQP